MPLTMNTQSMFDELHLLLLENEKYISVSWATLTGRTPKLKTYLKQGDFSKIGASNIYAYAGVTKTSLNIITLNSIDPTRTTGAFRIPLKDIKNITMKNNILKCSITFEFENESFSIHWLKGSGGTNIKNQRKYVEKIILYLSNYYNK